MTARRTKSGGASSERSISAVRVSASGRTRKAAAWPYKLLAIDLDGTLLDHKGEAHEEDIVAIKKLKACGVKVTILTGRLYSGAEPTASLLGIDGPVGCADGSHIVRVHGHKTLLHHGIRGSSGERLQKTLERNGLVAFLFTEDRIVHDERGADYLPFVRTWSTDLRYVRSIYDPALWGSDGGMTAVVALGREADVRRGLDEIQQESPSTMQGAVFPFRRDPERWGMVVRACGGTKATALEWISRHYGVDVRETVCVGDWFNDLPMLASAGRSFAMGQAPDEVKATATDVLERTIATGGGIAEAIARAFPR